MQFGYHQTKKINRGSANCTHTHHARNIILLLAQNNINERIVVMLTKTELQNTVNCRLWQIILHAASTFFMPGLCRQIHCLAARLHTRRSFLILDDEKSELQWSRLNRTILLWPLQLEQPSLRWWIVWYDDEFWTERFTYITSSIESVRLFRRMKSHINPIDGSNSKMFLVFQILCLAHQELRDLREQQVLYWFIWIVNFESYYCSSHFRF